MQNRTYSKDLKSNIGQEVIMFGRAYGLRALGGVNFLILQDQYGLAQVVFDKAMPDFKIGALVKIKGVVKEEKRASGGVEVGGKALEIISQPIEDLPFDMSKKELAVNLNTLLDHRPISIRHEKVRAIF